MNIVERVAARAKDATIVERVAARHIKDATDAKSVRALLATSIKHMKDIQSSHWEGFEKKNPALAKRTIQMAAADALRAMEEADKLLAAVKQAAEEEASISRPTPSAEKEGMNLPANHLNQFPSGKWGFVGSVDVRLNYLTAQGHELDLEKDVKFIDGIKQVGPGMMKAKSRVFGTPAEAMSAAKHLGQGITVAKHDMAKHPEIAEALKTTGVKHKIQ